jgi:hypothetical protein
MPPDPRAAAYDRKERSRFHLILILFLLIILNDDAS